MIITALDGHTLNPGDNPWTSVERLGKFTVHERTRPENVVERSRDADILLTNKVRLTDDILGQLPKLKYIVVTATGYDVVDVQAAKQRGIPVSNVPGYAPPAVAQHVYALILELASRVASYDKAVRDGEWAAQTDFCIIRHTQMELAGKTLGVVGFGAIGQAVARIGHAFGMHIVAHVPRPKPMPDYEPFSFVDLEELFEQADIISLHCPQTADNERFVNAALLQRCKPTALLINTARGTLISETALADALEYGRIGGAGLDVLSVEPNTSDNPLLRAPNCVITPHVAWATLEARKRLMDIVAANIHAFQKGNPINMVNG